MKFAEASGARRIRAELFFALMLCFVGRVSYAGPAHSPAKDSLGTTLSPREEVKQTIDAIVSGVEAYPGDSQEQVRKSKLREIINPRFDFHEMATRCLGQAWKTITPDQQAEFSRVFSDLLARTYLNRIETVKSGMVKIEDETRAPVDAAEVGAEEKAVVKTVVTQKGDNFPILYRVVLRQGSWKVYDVVIENIGLVANYRNEFGQIMRKEGFDGLLDKLKKKVG
jgi:phospholipid transport system substrate-binding protein